MAATATDVLIGSPGNDTLLGGAGDDVLIGGPGLDVLDGGSGGNVVIQAIIANSAQIGVLSHLMSTPASPRPPSNTA